MATHRCETSSESSRGTIPTRNTIHYHFRLAGVPFLAAGGTQKATGNFEWGSSKIGRGRLGPIFVLYDYGQIPICGAPTCRKAWSCPRARRV
jgi:hypothetical protein